MRRSHRLLAQAEAIDDVTIAVDILLADVLQKRRSRANHLEEASPGGMVLAMGLEVLGELVDPCGQNGDLDLGGTSVSLVCLVLFHYCGLTFLRQHTAPIAFPWTCSVLQARYKIHIKTSIETCIITAAMAAAIEFLAKKQGWWGEATAMECGFAFTAVACHIVRAHEKWRI
jgi:hypothetical protein